MQGVLFSLLLAFHTLKNDRIYFRFYKLFDIFDNEFDNSPKMKIVLLHTWYKKIISESLHEILSKFIIPFQSEPHLSQEGQSCVISKVLTWLNSILQFLD